MARTVTLALIVALAVGFVIVAISSTVQAASVQTYEVQYINTIVVNEDRTITVTAAFRDGSQGSFTCLTIDKIQGRQGYMVVSCRLEAKVSGPQVEPAPITPTPEKPAHPGWCDWVPWWTWPPCGGDLPPHPLP